MTIPQAVFGGVQFWQRLNRLANDAGHEGHLRALVGQVEHDDRYELYCQRCEAAIVEMAVDRTGV